MKHLFFGSVALLALAAAGPAAAADMAARAPVYKAPVVAPAFSWTGFYAGLNAGYDWSSAKFDWVLAPGFIDPPVFIAGRTAGAAANLHPSGFSGGGQIGYNWQSGMTVFGVEWDFEYLGGSASRFQDLVPFGLPGGNTVTESVKTHWLTTLRPRLGLAADRALFYITGGLAVANVSYFDLTVFPTSVNQASASITKAGWTAGAGIEYAINNNWTVKGEYLYVDLGRTSYNSINTGAGATDTITHNHRLTTNIARAGINYKFDWGKAPVSAKY